jgi:hypothetical protein
MDVSTVPLYCMPYVYEFIIDPFHFHVLHRITIADTMKDATQRILGSIPGQVGEKKPTPVQMTYPKPNQKSNYTSVWEPYVAANLHIYTIPLAIFLRRARELDFSRRDYQNSVKVVKRIFRVFTPEVVNLLSRLLASRQTPDIYSQVISRHEQNLGMYAPSSQWVLTLDSCKSDMHNLLEEMYNQHMKKVNEMDIIDRAISRVEGLFGQGAIQGEEKELLNIVNRAKIIVGFPNDYEVVPSTGSRTDSKGIKQQVSGLDRAPDGSLSDTGLRRMLAGAEKCNQLETLGRIDKMTARPQSHELTLLVPLLIQASNRLNAKFGLIVKGPEGQLVQTGRYRINLRWFADYRNILFVIFLSWFIRLWM